MYQRRISVKLYKSLSVSDADIISKNISLSLPSLMQVNTHQLTCSWVQILFLKNFRAWIPAAATPSTSKFLWNVSDRLQGKVQSIYLKPISFQNGNSYITLYCFQNNCSFCVGRSLKYISVLHTFLGLGSELGPFSWKFYSVSWHPGNLLKQKKQKPHRHRQQCGEYQRGRGWGR